MNNHDRRMLRHRQQKRTVGTIRKEWGEKTAEAIFAAGLPQFRPYRKPSAFNRTWELK